MATKLKITRNQLAKFIDDPDTIKKLEKLLELIDALELDGTETLDEAITRVHNSLVI